MKTMMILLTGIFVLHLPQANANTTDWNQILMNPDLTVEAPQIFFGSNVVSVLDVCVAGESIQPINPYTKVCGPNGVILDDGSCTQEITVKLSRLITSMQPDCGDDPEYGCSADAKMVKVTLPLTYSVAVYHGGNLTPDYENASNLAFTKDYNLPACP